MCVLHGGHGDITPFHAGIGPAFDEVDTRYRGKAHQIIHREDLGLPHQTIDHQAMLFRIDVPPTLVMALKMQTIGCDDAKERLKRREAHRCSSDTGKPRTLAPLQVTLILRWHTVASGSHRLPQAKGMSRQLQDRVLTLGLSSSGCST